METKTIYSIRTLFENAQKIRIPAYQRAYCWEEKQCLQFFEDLVEQEGKKYYLGQLLFEKEDDTLFIIDGQKRLTTTILFLSAAAKNLADKQENVKPISELYLNDSFQTITEDQIIFKKITQKHQISSIDDTETVSQRRLISAYLFFSEKLKNLSNEKIRSIVNTLENAVINTYYISNKIEATQVFEYQNNRGKELSRFEIIKAYLMHQVYLYADNDAQANNKILEIQEITAKTYRYMEAVEGYFSENDLLVNMCNLFYNISPSTEDIKKVLLRQENKLEWIISFFENLVEIAHSAKSALSNKSNPLIANLFLIGNSVNWKVVLLVIFYKGESHGIYFERILKLLEILAFKMKLGDYRSDYLAGYAKKYIAENNGYGLENLYEEIKYATENGFKWYWNNGEHFKNIIPNYLENQTHHYDCRTKFILWQYENDLRKQLKSGVLMDKDLFNDYTIEHINPQNPATATNSEEFREKYLHLLGNLALLTQSQNSKFKNKPFEEKSELFQDTALSSYTEIRANEKWGAAEITNRHKKIAEFAKAYFNSEDL